jgi:hypothetical protein
MLRSPSTSKRVLYVDAGASRLEGGFQQSCNCEIQLHGMTSSRTCIELTSKNSIKLISKNYASLTAIATLEDSTVDVVVVVLRIYV